MKWILHGGRKNGFEYLDQMGEGAVRIEHALDFGHQHFYAETYRFDGLDDTGRLIGRYEGLRRMGGIRLKFNPARLPA